MGMGFTLYGVHYFSNNETVLKLIEVMVAHICEYTKNHQILHFKKGELHLYKAVLRRAFKIQWKTQHLDHGLLMWYLNTLTSGDISFVLLCSRK